MKFLMNSLKKHYYKKQNTYKDSGRSMVEMLGVLAVMGVLAIGGIMGYTYAMNLYQANQLANEVNLIGNSIQVQMQTGVEKVSLEGTYGDAATGEGFLATGGYPMEYNCGNGISDELICAYEDTYYIDIHHLSRQVCQQFVRLIRNKNNLLSITVNEIQNATEQNCVDNADGNIIEMTFSTPRAKNPPEGYCHTHDECTRGKCYENICGCITDADCENPFYCDYETLTCIQCKSNDDCAPLLDTPICNKNACEPCPPNHFWDASTQSCIEGCRSNSHCAPGDYCKITGAASQFAELGLSIKASSCESAESAMHPNPNNSPYRISKSKVNVWASPRICEALGMQLLSVHNFECAGTIQPSNYCYKSSDSTELSDVLQRIQSDYKDNNTAKKGIAWGDFYTESVFGGRKTLMIHLSNGKIDQAYNNTDNLGVVVCY